MGAVAGPLSEWVELITPRRERAELRARVPRADEADWQGPAIQDSLAELQGDYAQAMRTLTLPLTGRTPHPHPHQARILILTLALTLPWLSP